MNYVMTKDELEKRLYLSYGTEIKLIDTLDSFRMNEDIKIYVTRGLNKYPKEACIQLQDVLYRNYYWIDTPYRMEEIYSNFKEVECMNKQDTDPENRYGIEITMSDGYSFIFCPDYIDEKNKKFFHYFDMSYFYCPNSPREVFNNILCEFENNDEWELIYVTAERFQKDYN